MEPLRSEMVDRIDDSFGERQQRSRRSTVLTIAATSLGPPLIAFLGHGVLGGAMHPWSLFLGAVLLGAWFGGAAGGIGATIVSTILVWMLLVPPMYQISKANSSYGVVAVGFLATGIVVSILEHRFRRSRRQVAEALAKTRRLNDHLANAIADRNVFAAVADNSSDFIGLADPSGTPIYINPAGRTMIELPNDLRIEDTAIDDYYHEDVREYARGVIIRAMRETGHWEGETRLRNWRTGASIPVWDTHFVVRDPKDGRVLGMATITRDMSAIVRTRTQLEDANERLHAVTLDLREAQRIGRIGSWYYDPKTDVMHWSDELFRIHGRDARGPAPSTHGAVPLFTPKSTADVDAANQKLLHDGQPYELDAEFIRGDGSTGWVTIRGIPVHSRDGEIVGITGTTQDTTELTRLQQLRQEWMSVVAHDLRQPIGVIKMAIDLLPDLHEGGSPSKSETEVMRRIRGASIDLARMVDDLLDVSRIEAHRLTLDRTWVDPRAIVDDTVARLSFLATGVRMRVESTGPVPRVYADAGRIGQVLGNLLSNAIKYGDHASDIVITLSTRGDDVTVAVTNKGKGIAPEQLSKLFQRFTRAGETRGSSVPGLGLGLYIAKGLVDAHGGRIWGESIPGETTRFSFTLPTHDTSYARAA